MGAASVRLLPGRVPRLITSMPPSTRRTTVVLGRRCL